ncbi:type III pantothenate kinase [Flagellimonas sp. DF-77]|uniref:type III pantothenate kinase n=1 Tax=Flagellimonas algarum TaxID=3230298 RepID=UPI003393C37A
MNLVVDIGNTMVKYGVFDKNRLLIDQSSESALFLTMVKEIFEVYPKIERAILSSVADTGKKEYEVLSLFCKVHRLSHESKFPFKNRYATPTTLGLDRIALAAAAFYHDPQGNTLVIDAGTCITYDVVNAQAEYLGGAISPGLRMRYTAMNEQTAKLPLLKPSDQEQLVGDSTAASMHSGAINGTASEIDGMIDKYQSHFSHLTVILTGGDALFFAKRLKNSIFANSNFLLEGLNYLLEYNKI